MRGLLLAALVEAGIITWRDLSKQKVLPLPSDYVAVAIVYGGLAMLPESASGFAATVGWGLVLATWLNLPFTNLIYPGNAPQTGSVAPSGAQGAPTGVNNAVLQAGAQPGGLVVTQGPLGPQFGTPATPVKAQ